MLEIYCVQENHFSSKKIHFCYPKSQVKSGNMWPNRSFVVLFHCPVQKLYLLQSSKKKHVHCKSSLQRARCPHSVVYLTRIGVLKITEKGVFLRKFACLRK